MVQLNFTANDFAVVKHPHIFVRVAFEILANQW